MHKFIEVLHFWLSLSYLDQLVHILSLHRQGRPVFLLPVIGSLLYLVDPVLTRPLSSEPLFTLVLNILLAVHI